MPGSGLMRPVPSADVVSEYVVVVAQYSRPSEWRSFRLIPRSDAGMQPVSIVFP